VAGRPPLAIGLEPCRHRPMPMGRRWRWRTTRAHGAGRGDHAQYPERNHCRLRVPGHLGIGVTIFYPLTAPDNASVAQLVNAWQPWAAKISQLHSSLGKPVVLTELGTTSEVGSYRSPYNWQHGGVVSLEAQRCYYAASCQALKPLVAGMYWWVYYTNYFDKIVQAQDPGYQPAGKPAEQQITACYQ
jgi:glycosyl hydrolase family 113